MNIYVGNLSYEVEETSLKEIFEEYGQVSSVKIVTDKFTGRSKGFGFIEMDDTDDAQTAMESLNGKELHQRSIVVNEAKPRTNNNRY